METKKTPQVKMMVARARVTKEMYDRLMYYVKKDKSSPSEVLRKALEMYFKAMEKDAV